MKPTKPILILLRGGGDLASGVALRLHRAGLRLVISELPQPLVVRRRVSFAEAVYAGQATVEDVTGCRVERLEDVEPALAQGCIPVLVDPQAEALRRLRPEVLVDGRMTKRPPDLGLEAAALVIGLGPGFVAGENCHAVIETNRGHHLGRVLWEGAPEADTGIPEMVGGQQAQRVLRAPADGEVRSLAEIGQRVAAGQMVAEVAGQPVLAPFPGVLRGLLYSGVAVRAGTKIGDVDPRSDPRYAFQVSDKSLAIGGGVLEAILSRPDLRPRLW